MPKMKSVEKWLGALDVAALKQRRAQLKTEIEQIDRALTVYAQIASSNGATHTHTHTQVA